MKKNLLSFCLLVISALGFCGYAQTAAEVADGTYWVYNVDNDAFLARNGSWGTMAVLTSYGQPVTVATVDGATTFTFCDSGQTLFRDGAADATDVRSLFCDNTINNTFALEAAGDAFVIKNISNGSYLKITADNGNMWPQAFPGIAADEAAKWIVMDGEAVEAYVNAKAVEQFNVLAANTGKSVASIDEIANAYNFVDMTADVQGLPTSRGESWQPAGDNNGGANNSVTRLSFSFAAPKAGLYKVTVPAMYRIASNAKVAELANLNMDRYNTVIYTDDYQAPVCNLTHGMTPELIDYPNYERDGNKPVQIEVDGASYWVPNSQDSFQAWAEAARYDNVVYAYAAEAGDNINVTIQTRDGRVWCSQWLVFNGELSRVEYMDPVLGTNLDFAQGTPAVVGVCTYAKDMEKNGTTLCNLQPVPGWDPVVVNADATAGDIFTYGSGVWLGGADYDVPATNPDGLADGNALGVVAVWSATAQYTQEVTLAPDEYTITFPIYNSVGGSTLPVKSLIGFIAEDGTEYLAPAKAYEVGKWTYETVSFTIAEETKGVLSFGYSATNSGSGSQQHLFVDRVEIHRASELPADMTALEAAVSEAQEYVLGFNEGDYAPYNNAEALMALDDAKAMLGTTQYNQELVDNVTAALANATWTANDAELNAIYNGDFHLSQPDGTAPYWSGVDRGGYGNSRTFVYAEPTEESTEAYVKNYNYLGALQSDPELRAALYLRWYENPGAWYNYGSSENPAYQMPLEAGVTYSFTCDFGQWGEGDGNNRIQIYDAAGKLVAEYTGTAAHLDAEGAVATHVQFTFTPTVSGNCRVSLWNPGNPKHYGIFSNFEIVRAPSVDKLFGTYYTKATAQVLDVENGGYEEISQANEMVEIAPGEENNQIVLLSDDTFAVMGNVDMLAKTITFPAQTVYMVSEDESGEETYEEATFCEQAAAEAGDYTKGIVATFDDEKHIIMNGWTLIMNNEETEGPVMVMKDVEYELATEPFEEEGQNISELLGVYTADNFSGDEYNFYTAGEDYAPFAFDNYAVEISTTEEEDMVAITGLVPYFDTITIFGKVDMKARTITFPVQTVYDYYFYDGEEYIDEYTFCPSSALSSDYSSVDEEAVVVATFDENYNVTMNGWTLARDYGHGYLIPHLANVTFEMSKGLHIENEYEVYFNNGATNWETVYAYAWDEEGNYVAAWPGEALEILEGNIWVYNFQTNLDVAYIIFNNGEGLQTEDLPFEDGALYGEDAPVVPAIYLRGEMNGWEANEAWAFTDNGDGIYTLNNVVIAAGQMFKVADAYWSEINLGGVQNMALNTTYTLYYNADNCTLAEDFAGDVVLNLYTNEIEFKAESGIIAIDAADASVDFYTLQGVKVSNPAVGNVYIGVKNGKAIKVMVK